VPPAGCSCGLRGSTNSHYTTFSHCSSGLDAIKRCCSLRGRGSIPEASPKGVQSLQGAGSSQPGVVRAVAVVLAAATFTAASEALRWCWDQGVASL